MHPFGAAAVKLGVATPAQVDECLALQAERLKTGDARSLAELLVERGYLSADGVAAVHKEMRVPAPVLPGYEILAPVGRGGMGAVFQGRQLKMNRTVAIKFLSDELAADRDFVKRFVAEAQTAAQFNHRNLVAAYDAGSVDGHVYFVMEFVKGRSLRRAVEKQGPMTEHQALLAAAAVADALLALEQRGMVHRDVKPENIMVTDEGVVKLCDFGLAKAQPRGAKNETLTGSGNVIVGTPAYMPPEQIRGESVDIRGDFYALGATLFWLATGRHPYVADTPVQVLTKHLEAPVPDPRALAPALSPGFAALVMKLMAKKREDRPAGGAELLRLLRDLLSAAPARPASRTGWWLAGTVAAAALVVAFGLVLMGAPSRADPPPAGPAPAVDPRREADARALWVLAETHRARGEWAVAKEKFAAFRSTFADTEIGRRESERAARIIAACEAEIADEARETEEERARIDAEIAARRWPEAVELIQRSRNRAKMADLERRCALEIEAASLIARAGELRAKGRWDEIRELNLKISPDVRETETARAHAEWLDDLTREVKRELAAEDALRQVRTLFASREWDGVGEALPRFVQEYGSTRTAREADAEIRQMAGRVAETREESARSMLQQAQKLLESRKPDEALEMLRRLEKEAGETDLVRTHGVQIAQIRDACHMLLAQRREQEAETLVRQGLEHAQAKKGDAARDALVRALRTYGETKAVKARERDIMKALEEYPEIATVIDFDRIVAWFPIVDPGVRPPKVDRVKEDPKGGFCGRFAYPDMKAAAVVTTVSLKPGSASIVFQAKGSSATKLALALIEPLRGDGHETYVAIIDVPTSWKTFELRLADFTLSESKGDGGNRKLDVERVSSLAIACPEARRAVVLLDDVDAKVPFSK